MNDGTNPLAGVTVTIDGQSLGNTDANGQVSVSQIGNGTFNYTVTADGYKSVSGSVTINSADVEEEVALSPVVVTFSVTNGTNVIEGATVIFNENTYTSDANGEVIISAVANGTYSYSAAMEAYEATSGSITVSGADVAETITLTLIPVYNVSFTITDGTNAIEGAVVSFNGAVYNSNASGIATINDLVDGSYDYSITASGYEASSGSVTIAGENVAEAIELTGITSVENSSIANIEVYPNPARLYSY